MPNNPPKNHHYVPQHFLKAWQSTKDKIFRYKLNTSKAELEVREVSIKKTASVNHLYDIEFPDGSFEIESMLVTPEIDQSGHKILEAARNSSILRWGNKKKKALANYLTCLEARNPEILEAMNIGPELNVLRDKMKKEGIGKSESIDEVIDYFQSSDSIGVLAFAQFLQNESNPLLGQPFSGGLLNSKVREFNFESKELICSNYPTARWGNYLEDFLYVIAISPCKAIVYSTHADVDVLKAIPDSVRVKLINLYTIAKADIAYFRDDSMQEFVAEHIGWAKKLQNLKEQQAYIGKFISNELSQLSQFS